MHNGLVYRFVAGKFAIIFDFNNFIPRNPETSISAENPQ
jgi:hypothetical protein